METVESQQSEPQQTQQKVKTKSLLNKSPKNKTMEPLSKYISSIMNCKVRSQLKYEVTGKLEDQIEYISIFHAVKRVMMSRTKMKKDHPDKATKVAENLEFCIEKLVAKNVKARLLMKLTEDGKHKVHYKGTNSAIKKLVKVHKTIETDNGH